MKSHAYRLFAVVGAAAALHACPTLAQVAAGPAAARDMLHLKSATSLPELERLAGAMTLGDAVKRALSANASVVLQRLQVRAEEGNVQETRGQYDLVGTGAVSREAGSRPLRNVDIATMAAAGSQESRAEFTTSTNYRAGVSRLLESGAQVDAGVSVNANSSTLDAASSIPQQTAASLHFGIRVPLVQNAGGIQQSIALQARELERDASIEDLVQASATTVLNVAQAYWELAGRLERIGILKESEKRSTALVEEIRKLVAADQIPGAELDLAQASESEKRAARIAEEQSFQAAWNALGRLLHSDTDEVLDAKISTDRLPVVDGRALQLAEAALSRRRAAVALRADVRAAHLRERAAYLQKLAAQDGLRPQIDLIAGLTTNGLAEGASSLALGPALDLAHPFPSLSVGVEMRVPFQNNSARGLLIARSSAHDQSIVRMRDLESSIVPGVVTASSALRRIALRYRDTLSAAGRYEVAVRNEYTKRRLGLSTLIDVINVQDRLDSAQLLLLQLRQEYAAGIAQLLFEDGELVRREPGGYRVDIETLGGTAPGKGAH